MWCYANHPLTLPILFTVSLGGGQPGTPRPFIWKSGQTVKRRTPATRSTLIFNSITSHFFEPGRDGIVEKSTATPSVSPAWRQISIGWRQGQIFSETDSKSTHEEKSREKMQFGNKIICFQSLGCS